MPKKEAPLQYLRQFIPEGSVDLVMNYLHHYKVHLTITRERKTVLGDYRHATHGKNHRISVNGSLNRYAFLVTLIHELAHLVTFMEYGNAIQPHGKEWKGIYRKMLEDFLKLQLFPDDIRKAIEKSMRHLPASSCADEALSRALKQYDQNAEGRLLIEQVREGELFRIDNGMVFRRGKKLRKRFQCTELTTGRLYLFSPIYEVEAAKEG
jgi:SprT protein